MSLSKLFNRIFFHNNTTPALDEDNLNAMSKAINDIDDRVINLAGTIMEDVPQIQEDIEELEEDFELIDGKITEAQAAAASAQNSANAAAGSVTSAQQKALIAEGWAKGTQNGSPVSQSSPYWQNNAEYFKDQAKNFTPTGYQDLVDDVEDVKQTLSLITPGAIEHAHILTIGDSYDRVSNYTGQMSNILGHGNLTETLSTNCWASADHFIIKCARGGSGFTNNGGGAGSGNGFLDRLTEASGVLTASERASIDYIVVGSGVNDCFYLSSDSDWNLLNTNMALFKTYASTYFPNAKILMFFIGNVISADNPSNITPEKVEVGAHHFQNVCGLNGIGYITNAEYVLRTTPALMDSDNLHPKASSGTYIALYLVSGIITGSVDVNWVPSLPYTFTRATDSPWNFALTCKMTKNIKNNITYVHINAFDATFSPSYTFSHNTYVKVATQTGMYAKQDIVRKFIGYAHLGTTWTMINVAMKFSGYDVYIAFCGNPNGLTAITADAFTTVTPLDFVINSYEI